MGFCKSCERNKTNHSYWPCQIPRKERANYDKCHAEEKGFPQLGYVPIPNYLKEKTKEDSSIEKVKRNLETACEILGWDNDHTLHLLQTKQFLKTCRDAEKIGVFDFEYAMKLIAKADRLHPYLEKTSQLISDYITKLKDGKLSGLDNEKIGIFDSVKYANDMKESINKLAGINP
jgi:hypothetical protein